MPIPILLAPILSKLAEKGFNLLSSAIQAKGKDFIEEKLGVNLESSIESEEGILKLRQLEIEHEEFLLGLVVKEKELQLADVNKARELGIELSKSQYWLPANVMPILALFTVAMSFVVLFTSQNVEDKMAAVSMGTIILGYFFGSSVGSKQKQEMMERNQK